jgi:hypothetical protein
MALPPDTGDLDAFARELMFRLGAVDLLYLAAMLETEGRRKLLGLTPEELWLLDNVVAPRSEQRGL